MRPQVVHGSGGGADEFRSLRPGISKFGRQHGGGAGAGARTVNTTTFVASTAQEPSSGVEALRMPARVRAEEKVRRRKAQQRGQRLLNMLH